jgi:hypothetical protein
MKCTRSIWILPLAVLAVGSWGFFTGCSDDGPLSPPSKSLLPDFGEDELALAKRALASDRQTGDTPPAELVTISHQGQMLTFWPYTGMSFNGSPVDPINLVFAGEADPLQIRAALMSLSGDRTAFGFPAMPPFDAVWTDAIGGDVQTCFAAEGEGWIGSVVQLTLGDYGPLRFHLRLFRTGKPYGDDGGWTLGGAHFELLIPNTADHQVLSWELAQQIVTVDLIRSGLLDADDPYQSTGLINAAPSFRDIPAIIYNGLPDELKMLIGGPMEPVSDPVPLASDGEGTLFNLAGSLPVSAGQTSSSLTVSYDQVVPKPFCAAGESDWLYVTGPVEFTATASVDEFGCYIYQAAYSGMLEVTPFDIENGVPLGPPYAARVSGSQHGQMSGDEQRIMARDRRLIRPGGGVEILSTRLKVGTYGRKTYLAMTHCIDEDI